MREKVNRASRRVWAETARRLLNCKRRSREMWGLMCFGKNEAEDRLNQNITRRGGAPCNDPARSVLCGGGFHRKRDFSLYNVWQREGARRTLKRETEFFCFHRASVLQVFSACERGERFTGKNILRMMDTLKHLKYPKHLKTPKQANTYAHCGFKLLF